MDTLVPVVIRNIIGTPSMQPSVNNSSLLSVVTPVFTTGFCVVSGSVKLRPTYQDCCRFCFLGQLIDLVQVTSFEAT